MMTSECGSPGRSPRRLKASYSLVDFDPPPLFEEPVPPLLLVDLEPPPLFEEPVPPPLLVDFELPPLFVEPVPPPLLLLDIGNLLPKRVWT